MKKKYELIGVHTQGETATGEKRSIYLHKYRCLGCGEQKKFASSSRIYHHTKTCTACHCRSVNNKPVSLRHFSSDLVENFPSIAAFCNAHPELGENAKYHFTEVLNGKRLHYKGWMRADNNIKINPDKVRYVTQTQTRLKDSVIPLDNQIKE